MLTKDLQYFQPRVIIIYDTHVSAGREEISANIRSDLWDRALNVARGNRWLTDRGYPVYIGGSEKVH
jgi:hypothetical protein